jgi:hypothetical protein
MEVGQGPNWGCSAKKKIVLVFLNSSVAKRRKSWNSISLQRQEIFLFSTVSRPQCEAGYTPPASFKVKNEWNYTSPSQLVP